MFSVIISEKGGAERRETFDRTEINVGRVQGNDLMLPKGNVSKRHARLLHRDGRFIVTDLKSTNGTYVNGRKISQATIVREGDKIYIGDFVLRIEALAGGASVPTPGPAAAEDAPRPDGATHAVVEAPALPQPMQTGPRPPPPARVEPRPVDGPAAARAPGPEVVSHFPLEQDPDDSMPYAVPGPPRMPSGAAARPQLGATMKTGSPPGPAAPSPLPLPGAGSGLAGPSAGAAMHAHGAPAPLSGGAQLLASRLTAPGLGSPAVPAPPPPLPLPGASGGPGANTAASSAEAPGAGFAHAVPAPGTSATSALGSSPPPAAPLPVASPAPPAPLPPALVATAPSAGLPGAALASPPPLAPGATPGAVSSGARRVPPAGDRERSSDAAAAHRDALRSLVSRVSESVGSAALDEGKPPPDDLVRRVGTAVAERVQAMKAGAELGADVDADALAGDATRELLELGPLGPLFEDEDVSEIQIMRHDFVLSVRARRQVPNEVAFTSEASLARIVRRMCVLAGAPAGASETFLERRLPQGARMFAVMPQTRDGGHMVVIRKPQRADLTLEDLVRSGTISRAMAGLLSQCIQGRANILVTGSLGSGTTSLLGALAAAGSTEDRVVVLQEYDEIVFNQPHTVSILLGDTAEEGARAVRAAARVHPERFVVGAFAGHVAAEVVDAIGDGADGVLAGSRAPTLRQALARLPADLAATRPGLLPETAREWLASAFDLAIEVARLRDGRHRVMRIAELAAEGGAVAARDVFTFAVERTAAGGAVEGSFHATGHVPKIVEDLVARGINVDTTVFKRLLRA